MIFAGTVRNDRYNNYWSRVKEEYLINRNEDSIWCNYDDAGGIGKGIKVKYACWGSAAVTICILL